MTEIKIGNKTFNMQAGKRIEKPEKIASPIDKIPLKYRDIAMTDFQILRENKEMIKTLRLYAERFEKNKDLSILLTGKVGTGKTAICYYVLKEVLKKGFKAELITINNIFSNIKNTYSPTAINTEKMYIEKLCKLDLLIIDDIGTEKMNDWSYPILYQIINTRYENMKATIFNSNIDLKELYKYWDERFVSRITEMAKLLFHLTNKDWRNKTNV